MPGFGVPPTAPPAAAPTAPLASSAAPRSACASGQLTAIGADGRARVCREDGAPASEGAPSPAGSALAFVRRGGRTFVSPSHPGRFASSASSDWLEIDESSIVVVDARSGALVARTPQGGSCLGLSGARWADERTVLVDTAGYGVPNVHNRGVCLLDVPSGALSVLAPRAICVEPIRAGTHRGRFYAAGWEPGPHGLVPLHALLDRSGRTVKRFAEDPFALDWDGDGYITGDELAMPCDEELAAKHAARVRATLDGLR